MTTQHIPSNANKKHKTHDAVEIAREKLTEALRPYFRGKTAEERLKKAINDCIKVVAPLITTREVTGQNLGGTVMTEAASQRNPISGDYGVAPRNL